MNKEYIDTIFGKEVKTAIGQVVQVPHPATVDVVPVKVDYVARLIDHFKSEGWESRLAGFGPMLTSPLYTGRYYYFPRSMDTKTIIPSKGLQRLRKAFEILNWEWQDELGIQAHDVIIGHQVKKPKEKRLVEIDWAEINQRAAKTAKTAGVVLGAAGAMAASVAGLALSALLVDPLLIVICPDESMTWIQVYKWFE